MKTLKIFSIILFLVVFASLAWPQPKTPALLQPFGLEGKRVTALGVSPQLAPSQGYLYATTDGDGVYRRALFHADSAWTNLGLRGKRLTTLDIQVWGAGPAIFHTPVVGAWPYYNGDSTLIYRLAENGWTAADSGFSRVVFIVGLASFASGGHEPPGFAFASTASTSGSFVYRSHTRSQSWKAVLGSGALDGPSVNALGVNQNGAINEIWIGGYNGLLFQPWIGKSVDMGSTWQYLSIGLNLGVENGCHAFAFHPIDPSIIYAGMDGTVIKTSDGGKTWSRTGLRDTLLVHFPGVAIDPFTPKHLYAGGRFVRGDSWVLWESIDAGMTWQKIVPPLAVLLAGITRIVADPDTPGIIYIATAGNGVWRYQNAIVSVKNRREEILPQDHVLEQNYPNPFNSGTVIRFEIPASLANVAARLIIYNLRGEPVRELLDKKLLAGNYSVSWDGNNDSGREVASGIYLYRLQTGNVSKMRKLSLLK